MSAALFPNIGAEEGDDWRRHRELPAVRALTRRFEELFVPAPLRPELGARACFAWLNTEEAARVARAKRLPLFGASPAVVRQVHDKAFARLAAATLGLEPAGFAEACRVFAPDELAEPDAALAAAAAVRERHGRFVLKPRIGTSGRGLVTRVEAIAGALPRLRERGGAVLEPWLERALDLATVLFAARDGAVEAVATLQLLTTPAGGYVGHRGLLGGNGRITSGTPYDGELRHAAQSVGELAARAGYVGACGVDAFTYRAKGGEEALRPIVEFNARFTAGWVALGAVVRHGAELARRAGVPSGAAAPFAFLLRADRPAAALPGGLAARRLEGGSLLLVANEQAILGAAVRELVPSPEAA